MLASTVTRWSLPSPTARAISGPSRTIRRYKSSSTSPSSSSSSTPTPKARITDPPAPPKTDTLPFLARPLGIPNPPGGHKPTWAQQTRMDVQDPEVFESKRLAERRHIIKEAATGYFEDLNATRRHGGKTWIAPRVLIREDKAMYMPDIEGTTLDTRAKVHTMDMCRGKISVISMLSTRISELHAQNLTTPTVKAFTPNAHFQYIQINVQENLLRSMLVHLFLRGIRSQVPAHLHPTYLFSSQNLEYIREPLGMTNKYIGYTFLVDENLRVRWAAGGDAKAEEVEGLKRCTGMLLERIGKTAGDVVAPVEL